MNDNKILKEIAERRSAESYTSKTIERDIIKRILEAGRLAPSAKNRQAWRFIAIDNKELLEEVARSAYLDPILSEAPVVIAVCTTNIQYKMPNNLLSYPVDLSFATAFMMLQAQKEGLSSRVITTYDVEEIKVVLNIPYSMEVAMLLTLGYSEDEKKPIDKKDLETVSSFNHW